MIILFRILNKITEEVVFHFLLHMSHFIICCVHHIKYKQFDIYYKKLF